MRHEKDSDLAPLAKAAEESGISKERILAALRDGEISEYPGRRYSLNELRALGDRPTVRQFRRRVMRG